MIYLDSAATTFHTPPAVYRAVETAMRTCASPGRGGYAAAQASERTVYRCRALAAELFDCPPESGCFTSCATEGLNIAIRTLVRPGDRVVISGLEHNAVTRPLHAIGAATEPVRAPLFSSDAWAEAFAGAVTKGTARSALESVGSTGSISRSSSGERESFKVSLFYIFLIQKVFFA